MRTALDLTTLSQRLQENICLESPTISNNLVNCWFFPKTRLPGLFVHLFSLMNFISGDSSSSCLIKSSRLNEKLASLKCFDFLKVEEDRLEVVGQEAMEVREVGLAGRLGVISWREEGRTGDDQVVRKFGPY